MVEFTLFLPKVVVEECASINEILFQEGITIKVEKIKGMQTNYRFEVCRSDIFTTALGQNLEGEDLLVFCVKGNQLCIKNEILHARVKTWNEREKEIDYVGIGNGHVL